MFREREGSSSKASQCCMPFQLLLSIYYMMPVGKVIGMEYLFIYTCLLRAKEFCQRPGVWRMVGDRMMVIKNCQVRVSYPALSVPWRGRTTACSKAEDPLSERC